MEPLDNDVVTKPMIMRGTKTLTDEKPLKKTFNTFHWELNLYSFSTLGLMYYLLPQSYRFIMNIIFALIALDAARYYYKKGSMAGVPYTLPFVTLCAMIIRPVRFWAEMASIAKAADGICTNTLVGHFMIFITDLELCRKVFAGEGTFGIYAHPNALWLLGAKNLIYLNKEPHKRFRAILTPALFSNEALMQYAQVQERVVRSFLDRFSRQCQESQSPFDTRIGFRTMAAAASQESFLGPYLTDEIRAQLEADILTFTLGFLAPPFPYFGSVLHTAIQAKHRIEATVRKMVPTAREYILSGNEPRCMLDHWSLSIVNAAKEQGCEPQEVPGCEDDDMARTVLDFLFAAQDATNSALTYSIDVLAAHPDVMDKIRREISESCKDDRATDVWTLARDPEALPYTSKAVNQLLHHKPPVPMVPHLAKKSTTLGGHYLGQGTIAIPSIMYSARYSGASNEYLPERSDADPLFVRTFTFGAGQHKCPGRRYAESLLTVFLAILVTNYEFERIGRRPGDDEFIYFPTLFPDENMFMIRLRNAN
jgi:cytochrome P450 family 710 subfamily A protein